MELSNMPLGKNAKLHYQDSTVIIDFEGYQIVICEGDRGQGSSVLAYEMIKAANILEQRLR